MNELGDRLNGRRGTSESFACLFRSFNDVGIVCFFLLIKIRSNQLVYYKFRYNN